MQTFGLYHVFYKTAGYLSSTTQVAASKEDAAARVLKAMPNALAVTSVLTVRKPLESTK